jgi:hypothetical protein
MESKTTELMNMVSGKFRFANSPYSSWNPASPLCLPWFTIETLYPSLSKASKATARLQEG